MSEVIKIDGSRYNHSLQRDNQKCGFFLIKISTFHNDEPIELNMFFTSEIHRDTTWNAMKEKRMSAKNFDAMVDNKISLHMRKAKRR